jgi:hypothetical protein
MHALFEFIHTMQFITKDLPTAKRHIEAVEVMVRMKGGPKKLGMNNFLWSLVRWFSNDPALRIDEHPGNWICKQFPRYNSCSTAPGDLSETS